MLLILGVLQRWAAYTIPTLPGQHVWAEFSRSASLTRRRRHHQSLIEASSAAHMQAVVAIRPRHHTRHDSRT